MRLRRVGVRRGIQGAVRTMVVIVCSGCAILTNLDGLTDGDPKAPLEDGSASVEGAAGDGRDADAASDSEASINPTIVVVQKVISPQGINTKIAPTTAGNLLVAVFVRSNPEGIVSVSDNAPDGSNTYVPSGRVTVVEDDGGAHCGTLDIWYARDVRAGTTSVSGSWTAGTAFGWLVEVSGVSATSVVKYEELVGPASGTVALAPRVTPSTTPAFVLSAVVTCGNVRGVEGSSPFTPLSLQGGANAAYLITLSPGSYGATWTTIQSTAWAGVTTAF